MNSSKNTLENKVYQRLAGSFSNHPALTICHCNQKQWQSFCTKNNLMQPNYQWFTGQYYHYYNLGNDPRSLIFNIMIFQDNKPVAIWRLNILKVNGKFSILTNTAAISPPLFSLDISKRIKNYIIKLTLDFLIRLAADLKISEISCLGIEKWSLDQSWNKVWLQKGATIQVSHECFLDLEADIDEIIKSRSKGCKSDIKKALSMWDFKFYETLTSSQMKEFQSFHQQVAGRATRSTLTWQAQLELLRQKESFAIFIYNNLQLIGCAQFIHTDLGSAYAFAAYERSLFKYPIAHGAQVIAIEKMQEMGLKRYHLGARCYPGCHLKPDKKEQSIGNFKASFASSIELNHELTLNINHEEIPDD